MLELLKFLHALCDKYDIKYTLEAGTLIGAIRDKGFIPWDDDSDVTLLREDYEKLLIALKSEKLPQNISVYYPSDKKEFLDFNLRLYKNDVTVRDDEASQYRYDGVFSHPTLDIYVMDYIPSEAYRRRLFVLLQQIVFGLAMSKRHSIKLDKYKSVEKFAILFLSKIGKLFTLKYICKLHDNFSKKYFHSKNPNDREYLYCTGWPPEYPGWVYKKELYQKTHLTDFEGEKFYALDAYDEVLTYGYGSWMTPTKTHDHEKFVENL